MATSVLTELLGTSSRVKKAMKFLVECQIIRKVKNHVIGSSSACYQLTTALEDERFFQVEYSKSDSALIRRLESNADNTRFYHKQLDTLKSKICLNEHGVNYLRIKYGELPQLIGELAIDPVDYTLLKIHYKQFYAHRPDLKSRVYSNLTNLPRIHRPFISFDGNPLLMTDIRNSQIVLTVVLIRKYWAKTRGKGLTNIPSDVIEFQRISEGGIFYERIAELLGAELKTDGERSDFKKKVFQEIWFSKNSNRVTRIKLAFKEHFPTVYAIIWALKILNPAEDHSQFAIRLQRLEASLIVDDVWKQMIRLQKSVLTLHDAIICSNYDDIRLARDLISDGFLQYNIVPTVKDDDYGIFLNPVEYTRFSSSDST